MSAALDETRCIFEWLGFVFRVDCACTLPGEVFRRDDSKEIHARELAGGIVPEQLYPA